MASALIEGVMNNRTHSPASNMKDIDNAYLLGLARESTDVNRAVLARTISDLFQQKGKALNDRERFLMFDILHQIVHEVEISIRQAISSQLAKAPDAPRDLIKLLANDEIEVAFPILSQSTVLSDDDLIEIVHLRTLEHQLAISIRETVSCEVSGALVMTNDQRVIRKLLENENSNISSKTMEYLVEQSERVDTFQEPILRRKELEPEMAKRMFFWVSAALRHYIIDNVDLGKTDIDVLIDQAIHKGIMDVAEVNDHRSKSKELAEALKNEGIATPETLLKTLKEGEVELFFNMFAQLTSLSATVISRVIFETVGDNLAIACKAIGVGRNDFKSIFTLSRKSKPGVTSSLNLELTRVLAIYDQLTAREAKKVIENWRRNGNNQTPMHLAEQEKHANA